MKIALSSGKVLMPQVGGQKRSFASRSSRLDTNPQGMDGEKVAIVVDSGSLAAPRMGNPTLQQQFNEKCVDGA